MRVLRWLLVLPGAILFGMLGSVVGGILATLLGQTAIDTSSAFFGPFVFIAAARIFAPSHQRKVMLVAAGLVTLLAVMAFALSEFTTIPEYASTPALKKILIPTAQILASLYAIFILPPFFVDSTLERLWKEINALGAVVTMLAVVYVVAGVIVGLTGCGWLGLYVGLGVFGLGLLTWAFPYLHLLFRMRNMERQAEEFVKGFKKNE